MQGHMPASRCSGFAGFATSLRLWLRDVTAPWHWHRGLFAAAPPVRNLRNQKLSCLKSTFGPASSPLVISFVMDPAGPPMFGSFGPSSFPFLDMCGSSWFQKDNLVVCLVLWAPERACNVASSRHAGKACTGACILARAGPRCQHTCAEQRLSFHMRAS